MAGALFMENLDGTIVVTATKRMAETFRVPAVDLNVVIAGYLLTLGVFIPVSGWVADRYGARRVFAGAIALFTVASALCGLSTSLGELTAMRVVQGVGGAMMVPVGRLVVLRSTAKVDLIAAIAYLTWPALAAPAIAPALGGALTSYASWRWIFEINVPLGVAALLLTAAMVPNLPQADRRPLDWWGFVLSGIGLCLAVGGLEVVTDGTAEAFPVLAIIVLGGVLVAVAAFHLLRSDHPLVDLRVFRFPTFRVTNVGGTFYRMAIGAAPFLLPLLFQQAFGWSALKAGLVVVPLFIGNLGIKPATSPILRRFGFRATLVVAGSGVATTLVLCAFFSARTPIVLVALVLLLSGAFRSVGFTAYNTIVYADVPAAEINDANTLTSTIQTVTMGLGVAVGALALRAGGPVLGLLGMSSSIRGGYAVAFLLVALLPLLAVVNSATLQRHAGSQLTRAATASASGS